MSLLNGGGVGVFCLGECSGLFGVLVSCVVWVYCVVGEEKNRTVLMRFMAEICRDDFILGLSWSSQIIFTNVGNPHALGQKPLTFPRQVKSFTRSLSFFSSLIALQFSEVYINR